VKEAILVLWNVRVERLQQCRNVLLASGDSDVAMDTQLKSNRAVWRRLLQALRAVSCAKASCGMIA
jgi:hypothetical protein